MSPGENESVEVEARCNWHEGIREEGEMVDMPLMILQKIQEAILFADICAMLWLVCD